MKPQVTIDFYDGDVFLRHRVGEEYLSRPVELSDIASAFANTPINSGLLPANALFWQRNEGVARLGVYIAPDVYRLSWSGEIFKIPLPGLIFSGAGHRYRVFAVRERPGHEDVVLYACPTPNVFETGYVCRGNVPFPEASADTIANAFNAFVQSEFGAHLFKNRCVSHPNDIKALWRQLHDTDTFPLDELVPVIGRWKEPLTVAWLLQEAER